MLIRKYWSEWQLMSKLLRMTGNLLFYTFSFIWNKSVFSTSYPTTKIFQSKKRKIYNEFIYILTCHFINNINLIISLDKGLKKLLCIRILEFSRSIHNRSLLFHLLETRHRHFYYSREMVYSNYHFLTEKDILHLFYESLVKKEIIHFSSGFTREICVTTRILAYQSHTVYKGL